MPIRKRISLSLFSLGLGMAVLVAAGAETPIAPNGPPPHPASVILQGDRLFYEQIIFEQVPETKTRVVEANGKAEQRTYTVMRTTGKYFAQSAPKDSFLVFTVGGKRLSEAEAATALAKETEVLISPAGKLLDPAYRPLFDPAALIIYIKPEQLMGMSQMPPPPAGANSAPPPVFSKKAPPQSIGGGVGFLRKAGDNLVLIEFDWEPVNEYRVTPAATGQPHGGPYSVPKIHWVPTAIERSFKRGELTTHNLTGAQTHGALFTDQPTPVFFENAADQFDPTRYKLCRSNAMIVRGNFPPLDFGSKYSAPPAPTECFARVVAGRLIVRQSVSMTETVREPVTAVENGKGVTKYVEKAVTRTKFVQQEYAMDAVGASDATGKVLAVDSLAVRLAKESPVLIATGTKAVDPQYLHCLRADAAILALPNSKGPTPKIEAPQRLPGTAPSPPGTVSQSDQVSLSGEWTFVLAQGAAPPTPVAPALEPAPASGPPPRFVRVQSWGDKLVLSNPVTMVGHALDSPDHGSPQESPMDVVAHWNSRVIAAGNFLVFEVDGRPVDASAFMQRARTPVIALFSDLGKKVDPVWLGIFKPGTLIVYVKPEAMLGGYGYSAFVAPAPVAPPAGQPQ